ncbi:MAG: glutamate-5-semialdehyde dehydrogenase [Chthoniobacterales bacterium]|nr:glutamate-5-semialdehyde dehydrogenase [Chthoniobacterales bacterium]
MKALESSILEIGVRARAASRELAKLSSAKKSEILQAMASGLVAETDALLRANAQDVARAEGLNKAAIDRLRLTPERIAGMAKGIRQVADLKDPVGEILREWTQPSGIQITKIRTPIGVIGIIYESRPNVTSDAAVLCLKTGNAVILRGGSEAISSNLAIASALQTGGAKAGLPEHSVQLVPTTDREAVRILAQMDEFLDVIIPRGGHSLIENVVSHARMPVIKHYHGVCHVYVDKRANLDMALDIALNAKCQRPGVCNAMETLLVHREIAPAFLARVAPAFQKYPVEMRADPEAFQLLADLGYEPLGPADETSWRTEYLDLILSVRVVGSLEEAVAHMETYGSHHSDAIVTEDADVAAQFLREVDSATVYWNASTRFTDGGEFGFGAEIGISTDKLHARGPMGLEELTSYKYLIRGTGQVR